MGYKTYLIMKKIIKTITIVYMIMFISCNKDLESNPINTVVAENTLGDEDSVKALLNGIYSRAISARYGLGSGLIYLNELYVSNDRFKYKTNFSTVREINGKSIQANNPTVNSLWLQGYRIIAQTNAVLYALDVVSPSNRDKVEGEALFFRGLSHFNLVKLFAQPYSAGSTDTNLGIISEVKPKPFPKVVEDVKCTKRSSIREIYNTITEDLTIAAQKLEKSGDNSKPNKAAAYAILARVYLQMNDYTKALTAVNNAISNASSYKLVSNYKDAFAQNQSTTENIFEIKYEKGLPSNRLFSFFYKRNEFFYTKSFKAQFDSGDARVKTIDAKGRISKWSNLYGNIGLIRLSELYLTRAECNTRLNSQLGDTPLNDYNKVYFRATGKNASSVDLDKILKERELEFFGEGLHYSDQKRLKKNMDKLPYNNPKLVFPIASSMMSGCPNTKQNKGY